MQKTDDELSDEQLEQVVGGSVDNTNIFIEMIKEKIREQISIKVPALLKPRDELNPKLWDEDKKLKSEIRDRLIEIANRFLKPTLGSKAEIKVRVGSCFQQEAL